MISESEFLQSEAKPAANGASRIPEGILLPKAAWHDQAQQVLSPQALEFLIGLHRQFEPERRRLMRIRREKQQAWNAGETPDYLDQSSFAVSGDWKVGPIPDDLRVRRVEITGPADTAKMVINMLNRSSGGVRADTAMLDFEDALKPSWRNLISGQLNVKAAAENDLSHLEPARDGKPEREYRLNPEDRAVAIVRPRGLHLLESNLRVDGEPLSGALMDLGLSFFHTAGTLVEQGKTPAYYIPKCEDHLEARWWNAVFTHMEEKLGLMVGTLKATFLIETLPAAFQMEEILYEIREHAAGLNVGRWDKIFSDIKTLGQHPERIMADRATITMQQPWMANYATRCVQICHQRGAYALGGMSAFTPGRTPEIREQQTNKVLQDKRNEAATGHDGCWVSHPYFIGVAMQAFERTEQTNVLHADLPRTPPLLPEGRGPRTMEGLRTNVRVGIGYLEGWSRDLGCVSWDNLMEDLATLEISRTQTWQWLHHGITLDDGTRVNEDLIRKTFANELEQIVSNEAQLFAQQRGVTTDEVEQSFVQATRQAEEVFVRKELSDFLFEASDSLEGEDA